MKKIFKKQVALLLAVLMVISTLGVAFSGNSTVARAEETGEEPAYMAKLTGAWIWVYQSIKAESGATYRFTCDYYVEDGGSASAYMWRYSASTSDEAQQKQQLSADTRGTVDISYTAEDIDSNVMVRFEGNSSTSTFYIWNVSLTKDDTEENLLTNADFEQGNGSWYGWNIAGKTINDETITEYNGQTIIAFDETLLPEGIPTGDPKYMAKIQVPEEQEDWIWIYQGITPEVGKTYRFICNYYVEQGSGGNAVMWSDSSSQSNALQTATQGAVEMTYEAVSSDTYLMVRFECGTGTTCYVWNVCLFELDGDRNLLSNGSFSKENGSTTGWQLNQSEGVSVIPFDKSLIPAPAYMAKMKGTHVDADGIMQTYVDVMQSIEPTAGITYTLRADYYDRAADGGASILLWSNTSRNQEGTDSHGRLYSKTKAATEGTLELTYTASEMDTILMIGIECDPEAECYFWNLSLTASNSNQNLLANADFKQGIGSWVGWNFGTNVIIQDEADSKAAVAAYGHEIVEFDRELLDSMKEEDALQKTYVDPNTSFQIADVNQYKNMDLDNPTYMAKLNGTYVDESGKSQKYIWVYQGITPQAGTTYHFSCEYYVVDTELSDSNASATMWTTNGTAAQVSMKKSTSGLAKMTYTAQENETWLNVRFECGPNGTCYIRNVRLYTDESDENLLNNGDFAKQEGSWVGWTISGKAIKDKAASDAAIVAYGQEILLCDWSLFNSELANWSVRPQLEETLDFTYQTELKVSETEGSTPEMTFVMYNGEETVKTEQVAGELGADGRYRFHLEVLPQQMEHQIIGTLNVQTADGEMIQTKQYSVRDYCVSILKDESCSNKLKNLVADLVRYGGETQAKVGIQDTLASDLESIISGLGNEDTLSDIKDYIAAPVSGEQTDEAYQWISASLVLNGKVTICLKFTADDITNLTVRVNDTDYTENGENIIQKNGNYYYVDIPVTAANYGDLIKAHFYVDGEATSSGKELSYSVHTYLFRMQDSVTSKALYQAIYRYGQSAKVYSDYLAAGNEDAVAQEEINHYLFVSEENISSRMNPQIGGADEEAKIMRETIMNADDTLNTTSGNVYYISASNGDDTNAGTSPDTAWKTLSGYRVNKSRLTEGDTVLFERGGIYRGEIASDKSILPLVSGVTYGAYGSGAKPAIYGSKQNYVGLGTWSQTDTENVWVCSEEILSDVGTIVFNHGQAVGVKRLKVSDDLATNLAELKSNFEFYHDLDTSKLYLYMDCNPSITFYDIEICENSYMLFGNANSTDITIENLSLRYGGGHAIRFNSGASNITITNCEIGFIGGSLQIKGKDTRYGNGIEFWNSCSNITVENNWIYQIYDAGFTHQGGVIGDGSTGYVQQDIAFRSNLVEYCSFGLEFWAGNPELDIMRDIVYENNLIRLTGYGWGMVRPNAFGVVAINTWGYSDTFKAENFKIQNNTFDLSTRALILSYYDTMPAVTDTGNSYYLKEGYVALWQGKRLLGADDQSTMETSVGTVDTSPSVVQFITE